MLFLAFKKVYSQVLLTNTPLDYVSFDLHALYILLAFTLSQNQTLLFEDIPICTAFASALLFRASLFQALLYQFFIQSELRLRFRYLLVY